MFKKTVLFGLGVVFIFAGLVYAAEESLTITTYYPSPYGVYRNLQLYPSDEPTVGVDRGLMYYNQSDNMLKYRNDTGWVNITGGGGGGGGLGWTLSGSNLTTTYNVGIGTTGPESWAKLDVHGGATHIFQTALGGLLIGYSTGSTAATIQGRTSADGNGDLIVNYWGGNVGIGTTTPTEKMDVVGNVRAAGFFYSSDRSLKKNIRPLSKSLDRITQLQGISFQWKSDNRKDIGLAAQEVEKVYPELVSTDRNSGLKSVEYGNLIAVLIESIKEQQKQIQELKAEIAGLKKKR